MTEYRFEHEYAVDEKGYPKVLPDISLFICPPFIMQYLAQKGIGVTYQQGDTLDCAHKWTVEYWIMLNSHFEAFHRKGFGDEEETIVLATKECELLFEAFIHNVKLILNDSFYDVVPQAQLWVTTIKHVVWEAFRGNRLSTDSMGNSRGTTRLLKSLLIKIDEVYDYFCENDSMSPLTTLDRPIMYNLWGDEYQMMIHDIYSKEILTTNDKEKVQIDQNKKAFYSEIEKQIQTVSEAGEEHLFYHEVDTLSNCLEELFAYYIRYYLKQKIKDNKVISFICQHWEWSTVSILHRAYTILSANNVVESAKGRFNFLTPCADGEEMNAPDKRAIIVAKATAIVRSICKDFMDNCDKHPWDSQLKALDIRYDDLYLSMKNRFLSGITLNDFKYAILKADFQELLSAANRRGTRSGAVGALYFFVSELGDNVGKEWLIQAAESVTRKQGAEAVALIRSHSSTSAQKEMRQLLQKHVVHYKVRKQKERTKQ